MFQVRRRSLRVGGSGRQAAVEEAGGGSTSILITGMYMSRLVIILICVLCYRFDEAAGKPLRVSSSRETRMPQTRRSVEGSPEQVRIFSRRSLVLYFILICVCFIFSDVRANVGRRGISPGGSTVRQRRVDAGSSPEARRTFRREDQRSFVEESTQTRRRFGEDILYLRRR